MSTIRRQITITGQVQGVGFRPFIYLLAHRLGLTGKVYNSGLGVIIEIQGTTKQTAQFVRDAIQQAPSLSSPNLEKDQIIPIIPDESHFYIAGSQSGNNRDLSITPDAAICSDCRRELLDPNDRRYRYPFINCTQCGPRYTIISDVPYDRPHTTMRVFKMCDACQAEYDNPANRRFHAQPNACPECGPHVWLTDATGQIIEEEDPIKLAVQWLEDGKILAVKGLGGFHLAVRADDNHAVASLRLRKLRQAKAFALMVRDLEAARQIATFDSTAADLLQTSAAPIVLCPKLPHHKLSDQVAPHSREFGIMLPYTPLHVLLMLGNYPALVMTSGNSTDEPIEADNTHALARLAEIADGFLLHDRAIFTSCDDSVVRLVQGRPMLLRRARGYVPRMLDLDRQSKLDILALGSDLKNTVTILKEDKAFVGQHTGDLENENTSRVAFNSTEKLLALSGAQPAAIVCDLHPAMVSSRHARDFQQPVVPVQHHHAHIAAVMGEYQINHPVIGLALDGLGYGSDGSIWGGELLLVERARFRRLGHLSHFQQPGGDMAGRQPWRMALSCLHAAFGTELARNLAKQFLSCSAEESDPILTMLEKGINCPATSSLGRLFDAVSALIGVCRQNTYEAQAAIELEFIADPNPESTYQYQWLEQDGLTILDNRKVIQQILDDLQNKLPTDRIAGRFHSYLINALSDAACSQARQHECKTICLAGGVFQNKLLLEGIINRLEQQGLTVRFNRKLPVNDGSISFGQAVVADALIAEGAIP